MKQMNIVILALVFCAFNCSQTTFKEYNSEKGYSFSYNELEWVVNENANQTLLFEKSRTEKKSSFQTNINIMVQDLSNSPLTLEQYHTITLGQIEQVLGEGAVLSAENIKISDNYAKEITYVMPKDVASKRMQSLKLRQVYFIHSKNAYLITYTSTLNQFDKYLLSAEKIFETFTVE